MTNPSKDYNSIAQNDAAKGTKVDPQLVPFLVLRYPLLYLVVIVTMTLLIKKQIILWFEHVLYIDEDEQNIYSADGDNEQQTTTERTEEQQEEEKTIHIRTYKFKTPQFIKKLTNTYFKKSKKEEKQKILRRDMLQNLKEAKASNHKKNKSEQFKKAHNREFSMFQNGTLKQGGAGKVKPFAIFKKEEDFFEFQDTERQNEVELQYTNEINQKQQVGRINNEHERNKQQRKMQQQRFMSYDFNSKNQSISEPVSQQRGPNARNQKMSVSLNHKDCCICFDSKPDAVIMECGHGGICYECGKHMIATEPRVCHLCREGISYILKMDLSTMYSDFIKVISATFIDDESDNESSKEENQQADNSSPQNIEQRQLNPQGIQITALNQNMPNIIPNVNSNSNQQQLVQELSHNRQRSRTVNLDGQNSGNAFSSHQRGNSLLFQQKSGDEQPVYFMQNPFYRDSNLRSTLNNNQSQNSVNPSAQQYGFQNQQDIVEFVSPRPLEDEERNEEDFNAFQSSFGGANLFIGQGAYLQFREIQEEIKEEDEEANNFSTEKKNLNLSNQEDQEQFKKQLGTKKFKLFSLQRKEKNALNMGQRQDMMQQNYGNFYKFENVSNPDSVILSARSNRISNIDQYEDDPQAIDFSGSMRYEDGELRNQESQFNFEEQAQTKGLSSRLRNHQKSLRETIREQSQLSSRIKFHKQRRGQRGGSIYLIEEFLSTGMQQQQHNEASQEQEQSQDTNLNIPNI